MSKDSCEAAESAERDFANGAPELLCRVACLNCSPDAFVAC